MKNNTLKYRVGQVEKKVDRLDTKLEAVMENHLPHIQADLQKIKVLVGLNVGGIIAGILIAKYL